LIRHQRVLASGIAERLGTDGAGLKLVDLAQKRHDEELPMADHRSALLRIIEVLTTDLNGAKLRKLWDVTMRVN
jgi:acetate kinase